jgi:hypothetical protein
MKISTYALKIAIAILSAILLFFNALRVKEKMMLASDNLISISHTNIAVFAQAILWWSFVIYVLFVFLKEDAPNQQQGK